MLSSVTVWPIVFVDMTTSIFQSQCGFLENWKRGHKDINENVTLDARLISQARVQVREGSLWKLDILAISTDFRSGKAESAGWAVENVGMEALGEVGRVEEKRPKQTSGQVLRR